MGSKNNALSTAAEAQAPKGPSNQRRVIIVLIAVIAMALVAGICGGVLLYQQANAGKTVLNPNVLVYEEGVSPFQIISADDGTVVVSNTEGISTDTILNAGVTEQTPYGLLCKVTAIEPADGGYQLTTEPAALTEAIERCHIEARVTLNEDGTYGIDEQEGPDGFQLVQQAYASEGSLQLLSFSMDAGPVQGSAGVSLDFHLDVHDGKIDIRIIDHVAAEVSLKDFSGDVTLFKKELGRIIIPVGPGVIVLVPELSVGASGDVSLGSLGMSAVRIDEQAGFQYTSDEGLRPVQQSNSAGPSFTVDGETVSASAQAKLSLALGCDLFGLAGAKLGLGVANDTKAALRLANEAEAADENAIVLPGTDVRLCGFINTKVYVPLSGGFEAKVPFNPFDLTRSASDLEVTLFDTGDAITVFDMSSSFGVVTETYETTIPSPFPGFAFDYPSDWTVTTTDDGRKVTLASPHGAAAHLVLTPLHGGADGIISGPSTARAIASSELQPPGASGTASGYQVSEIDFTSVDLNLLDYADEAPQNAILYALTSTEHPEDVVVLYGHYSSAAVGSGISFYAVVNDVSEQERAQIVDIMASFRRIRGGVEQVRSESGQTAPAAPSTTETRLPDAEFAANAAAGLGVPMPFADNGITYAISINPWWWDGAAMYLWNIEFYQNGKLCAGASCDSSGSAVRSMHHYTA